MTRTIRLQAALAVCVFLFIGLGFAFIRPGLTDYRPYLSFSPDVDGTKALRSLLERERAQVREWRFAPDRLPEESGGLYLAIEPDAMTNTAASELERWASEYGNDVVVLESVPGSMGNWKAEQVELPETAGAAATVTAVGADGEWVYEAAVGSDYRLAGVQENEVLLHDELGVIAARRTVGEGSVTVAVVPEWTQNSGILDGSRFDLLWWMLGASVADRAVYVDEYHHGYAVSPGLSQVYPPWLIAAFAQTAIAVVFWLWYKGKRFGPAVTPREFRVRRSDETLLAVAGWYRRGKLTRESLGYRIEHMKRALAARGAGLRHEANAGDILASAKRVLPPKTAEALAGVLDRWERAEASAYSEKQWLADSAVLDEAVRSLEEEG
ncbi:DUF4350 domain-containing protein [Paenibacillus alkalitolerans]|uniref:DUF4350 domain-containing protein n=1 Tax=Paenibacillus alkalitolerans TaxID=2799335 RepID=UPI0018F379DC|nr:DUF4350 domain-containing protein [Paenibacillus alkalitolerans]